MYDAFSANTGQPPISYMSITNVTWGGLGAFTRGSTTFGPNGEILSYRLDTARNRLTLWNETKAVDTAFPWVGGEIGQIWNPGYRAVIDGNLGIEWNVSVPALPPGSNIVETGIVKTTVGGVEVSNTYILASNTSGSVGAPYAIMQWAYLGTLTKDSTGKYPTSITPLWTETRTNVYMSFYKVGNIADSGIYTMFDESRMQFHGFDIKTGQEQWVTDPIPNGWGQFIYDWIVAYGKLYEAGYDGHVRAYDATNGKLVWDFYFGSSGYETAYGSWPEYNGFTVADHKVFVSNDEHSPDSVMWRGGKLWAINADTGQGVWNISGWDRHPAISNGILTALNSLDGQAYGFGKGPSATTVSAPQTAVGTGQSVTITGTVTDQSPGQPDTPAISEKDMTAWMEYLHMQKPMPTDATGVSVDLKAIDSSGTSTTIGTTTSDANGNFGYSWTPTTSGLYKIVATFAGTNSYGGSSATAYLTVVSAPSASPSGTPGPTATAPTGTPAQSVSPSTPTSPTGGTETAVYVAVAAAVIVVVLALVAVVLRRRK
jgi:hypothetical protein